MEGQASKMSQIDSQPLLWMTVGRSMLEKSDRTTWCFEWMNRLQKFSENSFRVSSSQNRTEEGVGLKEEDTPKRKGF